MGDEMGAAQARPRRWLRPRLAAQVALGLGGLLALLVVAITVALVMVVTVRRDESSLSDRDVPYASAVASAALNAKGIATDQRGFLLTGDKSFVAEAEQRVGDARTAFAAAQDAATNTAQRDAIRRASSGFEDWVQAVEDEFATFNAGNHKAAIAASLGPERQMRKAYERSLATAQAAGQRSIRAASSSATTTSSRSLIILVATLVAAIVVGSGVMYWLFHTIAFPVFKLAALLTST
jgi:methyl-accepting chemotaxis protein